MTLSVKKFESLLVSNNLVPKQYFVIDNICVYVEVYDVRTSELFLLYIPSRYEISVKDKRGLFELKYIELNEDGTIPGDYGADPDNTEMDKIYNDIEINLSPDKNKSIAENLESNYNHPVSLTDISNKDKNVLRDILRQLRRLKLCVQNIKYKLAIVYKHYLCCIRRDDSLECFIISGYTPSDESKLYITTDLETYYTKVNSISSDIPTVRQGVYNVLNKNQIKHAINFKTMLENNINFSSYSDDIYSQKEQIASTITDYELVLGELIKHELKILEKANTARERSGGTGLYDDMERSKVNAKYDHQLEEIRTTRDELVQNLAAVRQIQANLMICVDKIFFDNSVMLDAIIKNMQIIKEM